MYSSTLVVHDQRESPTRRRLLHDPQHDSSGRQPSFFPTKWDLFTPTRRYSAVMLQLAEQYPVRVPDWERPLSVSLPHWEPFLRAPDR
jgi:hypothetical protein